MPEERTFGFSLTDATDLLNGITAKEGWFPEIRPRGGGGSGGGEWIEFTVVDVFCRGDYDNEEDEFYITATVDWYSNSCTKAPTGYDEYTGTIKIYDKCVLQYYTPDQLMGLNGHTVKSGLASLMRPFRKDSCEPRWLCQSVCGEVLCGDTDWPPEDEEETE